MIAISLCLITYIITCWVNEKMNIELPKALAEAKARKIEFFMGEACEWKFDIEEHPTFIENLIGTKAIIFANNGYGDYLFLKVDKNRIAEETIFEFFHEGPEINEIEDDIELLLGLKERPPSTDDYPKAVYESGEDVQIGDHVQLKTIFQFWRGWQNGTVKYVPGMIKEKPCA